MTTRTQNGLHASGLTAAGSAGLHGVGAVLSGFNDQGMVLVIFGLICAALAYGLIKMARWVGYVAFLAMFAEISYAIANFWTIGAVPSWVFGAIALVNTLCILILFLALWKTRL